jgi:broad specificity phosphatase PhoE
MTELGLFRHGQTDWNIDLRLQGTADVPLNQTGIAQVEKAAEILAKSSWDVILASPLGRAKHSAEIIQRTLGHQSVTIEPLLLERAFGIGEGMDYKTWQEQFAHLDEIPGAEAAGAVAERSRKLLEFMEREYQGAKVLAVSHGALIRFVLHEVTSGEIPPKGERLQNASLHLIRHQGAWQLEAWAPEPLGERDLLA